MKYQQNTEDNYKKIQQTFPDFESLTAFFEDKTAEYEGNIKENYIRLSIYKTRTGLELSRSDGYRASIVGISTDGRFLVKNEMLLYQKLDGGVAYKSLHGALYGITLSDIVIKDGKIEKIGVSSHGFAIEGCPDILYLTIRNHTCGCYIATCVYGSYNCPKVWILRRFRDQILATTWYGRVFIHCYYVISPTLVKFFGNTYYFRFIFKVILNSFTKYLYNKKGIENTPYIDPFDNNL